MERLTLEIRFRDECFVQIGDVQTKFLKLRRASTNKSQACSDRERVPLATAAHNQRFHGKACVPRRESLLRLFLRAEADLLVQQSLGAEIELGGNAGEDQKSRSVVRGGPQVANGFSDDR